MMLYLYTSEPRGLVHGHGTVPDTSRLEVFMTDCSHLQFQVTIFKVF
jgi:hypothetical protein